MPIIHIVLFAFAPSTSQAQIEDVCNRMTGLASTCTHPDTGKTYFKSYSGGKDNSPEGRQGGFTHGFVCEFATSEDRDYYVAKDPAHQAFVQSISGVVVDARVLDYEAGKF